MKNSIALTFLAVILACTVTALISSGEDGREVGRRPMYALVQVGDKIKVERAISGGYNLVILNERYIKSFEKADPTYVPDVVKLNCPDHITLQGKEGAMQTIAIHAVHVITTLPE